MKNIIRLIRNTQFSVILFLMILDSLKGSSQVIPLPGDSNYQPHPYCKIIGANSAGYTQNTPIGSYPSVPLSIEHCGKFDIYYEDIYLGVPYGFNDPNPIIAADRRACVCAVFTYLQSVFNFSNVPSNAPIKIEITQTYLAPGNPSPQPSWNIFNTMAAATILFPNIANTTPGYYGGYVYDKIVTPGATGNLTGFDGRITLSLDAFNCIYTAPILYHNDPTTNVGHCETDLYSIILHETLHLMGWFTMITEGGSQTNPIPVHNNNLVLNPNAFSVYDNYFNYHFDDILANNLNQKWVINGNFGPVINPNLIIPGFTKDNKTYLMNIGRFQDNAPVYSGDSYGTIWYVFNESNLNHLDEGFVTNSEKYWVTPGCNPNYVMSPNLNENTEKRIITNREFKTMLQLGYSLNPIFSATNVPNITPSITWGSLLANNHKPECIKNSTPPNINNYANLYNQAWIEESTSTDVYVDHVMNNDIGGSYTIDLNNTNGKLIDADGDDLSVFPNSIVGLRGVGIGGNNHNCLTQPDNSHIIFTPRQNFIGRAQFYFQLFDGKEKGAIALYTIDVLPGTNFVNNPPNEMILNGSFEEGTEVKELSQPLKEGNQLINFYDGQVCAGQKFADSHPYFINIGQMTTHDAILVRNSFKDCSASGVPYYFGFAPSSFPTNWFSTITPNAITASENRYGKLISPILSAPLVPWYNIDYSTLASPTINNHVYRLTFDFYNSSIIPPSTIDFLLRFTNDPDLFAPTVNFDHHFNITPQVGNWFTVTTDFYYCNSTGISSRYCALMSLNGNYSGYIDNMSMVEITNNPLTVSATANILSNCHSWQLNATPTPNPCLASYSWSPSTGLTATNIANPIATVATTTTYIVTVSDGNGNTATSSVIVYPTLTITATATPSTICAGQSSILTVSGASTYTWNPGGLTGNSVTVLPGTTTTYTVIGTSANGICTSTNSVIVTVNPSPMVTISSSPNTCVPVTLTATGAPNYTWSPGGSVSSTINVTTAGVYTVTGTDANGCSNTSSITINGFTASITSTTGFHCTPNELHAWPQGTGYSYHWYPPIGTSSTLPVNLPDFGMTYTQGTYTVIVTDGNGCASSATFSLSNGPDLTSLSAIMNGTICGSSATLSVGLNSGLFPVYTFLWTPISPAPGFSTSNTLQAVTTNTLNSTSSYSVIVTDGVGCTSTGSITVQPLSGSQNFCSCQGGIDLVGDNTVIKVDNTNSNDLATNPIYGGGTPLGTNISGKKFYIDGNFIINLSMIFDNCTIYVSPNSRITVNSGTVLQIINNTKLQSPTPNCPMWDGIYASDANSEVIINGQSTIRDMENGVIISAAAKLNTNNAKYYDNRISIQLNNLPATYSGEITNCTFESVTGLISPWTSLIRPLNGIIIANCKKATVGTPGNGNFFKSLHNGVYIYSNFINSFVPNTYFISLFYNRFEDIIGGINLWTPLSLNGNTIYNTSKGCAILGINKNPKSKVNISIWGDALPNGNIMNFKNCNKAIILNGFDAQVHNNRTIGTKAGILFNQVEGKQMWVEGNELNDVLLGISKIGNEASTTWGYYCEKNKITLAWGGSPLSGTNYLPMGINSNYFSSVNNGYTLMKDNIIKIPNGDYSVGLHLQNGFNDYIYDNDIEFNYAGSDPAPHPTPELFGIDLSNNVNAFIFSNTIHGQNVPMFLAQRRIAAIQMHHNDQSFLDCNLIDNVQFGFYVVGNNNTQGYDHVRNNHINTQNAGMLFRHLSNEGTLGDIGLDLPNNKYDANNKFSGGNVLSRVYRFCIGSPTNDKIITQSTNLIQTQSLSSGVGCSYNVQNPSSFTTPPYLCSPPNYTLSNTIGDEDNAEQIAEDSTEYVEYEDGGRWLDNQMLMRWLHRDTTTMQNNPILNAYYLSHYQDALGYLYDVDNMLAALSDSTLLEDSTAWRGLLLETKDMNNAISCSTLFETNEKAINTLYIKYLELGLDALSETDINFIQDLADNCPYIDGNAVFKARNMYSMFVPNFYYNDLDICNQIGVYKGGKSLYEQENNLLGNMANSILPMDELKVYPNPTDGQINIDYHINHTETAQFTIYNIYGNIVNTATLDGEKNKVSFSLSYLPRGFYTYKCTVTGRILTTGKIILK